MKRLDCGKTGSNTIGKKYTWKSLSLDQFWQKTINILHPDTSPREVQAIALGKTQILENRKNLIVSAPTNSGKSLIGTLVLIDAIRKGRRAVLIEPLRALAQEKTDKLQALSAELTELIGNPFKVCISTGDYKLEEASFSDPPPEQGELIVATPERLESIFRNPEYHEWLSTIDAVCVDEAHLISSSKRGPTLECLITSFLLMPTPPRIVLLSATFGDTTKACHWLSPCEYINITNRYPVLHKELLCLEDKEDVNDIVQDELKTILESSENSVLIFVYQTSHAEKLAKEIQDSFFDVLGENGSLSYHMKMNTGQRHDISKSFIERTCRVLVTTTGLGLGINLPATHVIIRDTTFHGFGPLSPSDLIQMMGRAGRDDTPGYSSVILRKNDSWKEDDLKAALEKEQLPDLVSTFDILKNKSWQSDKASLPLVAASLVASLLSRFQEKGLSIDDIKHFFERSLGGGSFVKEVEPALQWLTLPNNILAYENEHLTYHLTVLGLKATHSAIPLDLAAGYAQLMRDLLSIDQTDAILTKLNPIDHLIIIDLLFERSPNLRLFSNQLADQVDSWVESNPEKIPFLFREWISGQKGASKSIEVVGSLGINPSSKTRNKDEWARKKGYVATFRSIVLYERGLGKTTRDLERKWKIKNLTGIEEKWRDEILWLLSGISKILDIRCFYYHLKEDCEADKDRVQRVKKLFKKMQFQTYELMEHIKYCSALGPLLKGIKKVYKNQRTVGIKTIRRLEENGIQAMSDIIPLKVDDLVSLGIQKNYAKMIKSYISRRLN